MKVSKYVEKARRNLLELRDNVFFDKLKQTLGIIPQNDKEHYTLIKLADDLAMTEKLGEIKQSDHFSSIVKQATLWGISIPPSDVDAFIQNLISKLAEDETFRESAALLFESEVDHLR